MSGKVADCVLNQPTPKDQSGGQAETSDGNHGKSQGQPDLPAVSVQPGMVPEGTDQGVHEQPAQPQKVVVAPVMRKKRYGTASPSLPTFAVAVKKEKPEKSVVQIDVDGGDFHTVDNLDIEVPAVVPKAAVSGPEDPVSDNKSAADMATKAPPVPVAPKPIKETSTLNVEPPTTAVAVAKSKKNPSKTKAKEAPWAGVPTADKPDTKRAPGVGAAQLQEQFVKTEFGQNFMLKVSELVHAFNLIPITYRRTAATLVAGSLAPIIENDARSAFNKAPLSTSKPNEAKSAKAKESGVKADTKSAGAEAKVKKAKNANKTKSGETQTRLENWKRAVTHVPSLSGVADESLNRLFKAVPFHTNATIDHENSTINADGTVENAPKQAIIVANQDGFARYASFLDGSKNLASQRKCLKDLDIPMKDFEMLVVARRKAYPSLETQMANLK